MLQILQNLEAVTNIESSVYRKPIMRSLSSRCEYCQKPSDIIFHGCRTNMFLWSSANIRHCKPGDLHALHIFVDTSLSIPYRRRCSAMQNVILFCLVCFFSVSRRCPWLVYRSSISSQTFEVEMAISPSPRLKHPHLLYRFMSTSFVLLDQMFK
jgi:hypothetical protein